MYLKILLFKLFNKFLIILTKLIKLVNIKNNIYKDGISINLNKCC